MSRESTSRRLRCGVAGQDSLLSRISPSSVRLIFINDVLLLSEEFLADKGVVVVKREDFELEVGEALTKELPVSTQLT